MNNISSLLIPEAPAASLNEAVATFVMDKVPPPKGGEEESFESCSPVEVQTEDIKREVANKFINFEETASKESIIKFLDYINFCRNIASKAFDNR